MSIFNASLVALSGAISGALLGVAGGFAMASHTDVLRGVRPNTTNRLILFLARPSREFGLLGGLGFLLLLIVWLAVFCLICALPALVAQWLDGDGPPLVLAYLGFVVAILLGRSFGAHMWGALA